MNLDLAIRSTRVVTPQGERAATLLVADGRIVDLTPYGSTPAGIPLDDWGDLAILPGFVDTHVHCNEPGRTEWEGFETATRAAIAGGITTIVDMPLNSTPVTTTVPAFRAKLSATEGKAWCDIGFWGGVVPGNHSDLEPLMDAGVLGFKAFLCDSGIADFPATTADVLGDAMRRIAGRKLPLLAHCELVSPGHSGTGDPHLYATWLNSRPATFERDAIAQLIALAEETECRVHIVHLADAECEALIGNRARAPRVTVETCPHYLHFAAEDIPAGATQFKCAPPIRSRQNREALWKMLLDGSLQMVVSDHSPCPPEMKQLDTGDFPRAWGGISSLQLGPAIVWSGARARGATLTHLARWMSGAPAQLAGLAHRKGSIAEGSDADFAIFDPNLEWTVDATRLWHRHKLTPYDGQCLRGQTVATYLRGVRIFQAGNFAIAQPTGNVLPHHDN
jgi:allantoinase